MDDDIDEQRQKIKPWSSFELDDAFERDEKMMKEKLHQLELEMDKEFDVNPEKTRHYNFMAYLYWKFGDRQKAFAFTVRAEKLKEAPSLITQCNKIIFYMESGEYFQSDKLWKSIETDMFQQENMRSRANAEIAYCYTRLGPKHHGKAVQLFRKAIDDINPERNIAWEYGLALTLRRQSHPFQMLKPEDFKPDENKKEAAFLLYGVVRFPVDNYCQIKAWAWCELGKILHNGKNLHEITDKVETETEKIDQTRCYVEALKLCPNDPFVLQLYGTHLRYINRLQESKEVFEKVISLRDEAISRHHLALTLKKIVQAKNPRPKIRTNLQHSFSVDERLQSTHDTFDSGIYSMSEKLGDLKCNESAATGTARYRRSQSDYQCQSQKKWNSASGITPNFYVPKVSTNSKSVLKCQPKIDYNNSQHFFSVDERLQSTHDTLDSGIYSMSEKLGDSKCNKSATGTAGYRRSQSDYQYQSQKKWISASGNTSNFYVTKFPSNSKSVLKCQPKGDYSNSPNESFVQKNGMPFYHDKSDSEWSKKRNFISARKSPRIVCISPGNSLLMEAVEHLKKAIEMCEGFDAAWFDLGLIYRMLDKPEEARKCFSFITSKNCGKPYERQMILINAYEQQAICKLGLVSEKSDEKQKESLIYDARRSMWKALTLISGVIGAVPLLKTTSQCFPTLKMLLQNEKQSTQTLTDLAKLHDEMGYTKESIEFYEKINEIEKDPKISKKLVENYQKIGDFENAICILSLLQYTEEKDVFEKSFYVDTYIRGANASLEKGDFEMAKIRFLKVYETINSDQSKKDDESPPDVLILDSCNEADCRWINSITLTLESFVKLQVVVNHTECPPNRRKMDYLKRAMGDAKFIFSVLHDCENTKKDEYIDFALELLPVHHRAKTLLVRVEGCNYEFPGCTEFVLSLDHANVANDSVRQGTLLSNMLSKMAEIKKNATRNIQQPK